MRKQVDTITHEVTHRVTEAWHRPQVRRRVKWTAVILLLVNIIGWSYFSYFATKPERTDAAPSSTIVDGTSNSGTASVSQRRIVRTNNGANKKRTFSLVYTGSTLNLYYTDDPEEVSPNWINVGTLITTTTHFSADMVWHESGDNDLYIAYGRNVLANDDDSDIYYRQVTGLATTPTLGIERIALNGFQDGTTYSHPQIELAGDSGTEKVFIFAHKGASGGAAAGITLSTGTINSDNPTWDTAYDVKTWSAATNAGLEGVSRMNSGNLAVFYYDGIDMLATRHDDSDDAQATTGWDALDGTDNSQTTISADDPGAKMVGSVVGMSSSDVVWFAWLDESSDINTRRWSGTTLDTEMAPVALAANDVGPALTTDGTNLYMVYQKSSDATILVYQTRAISDGTTAWSGTEIMLEDHQEILAYPSVSKKIYQKTLDVIYTTQTTQLIRHSSKDFAIVTVGTTGDQTTFIEFPAANKDVGGKFIITRDTPSSYITSITIAEQGTVDAQNNLDNIKLYYDLDTSAPYDCASESLSNPSSPTESQFGSTDTDGFSAANGTSAFTGSVLVHDTQSMCVYVVLDVLSGTINNQTLEIEMTTPSSDVTTNTGLVSPGTAVAILGQTNLLVDPTISGTVWTDEAKTTNIGAGKTVHLFVNSTDKSTAETDANGAYTFNISGVAANDSVIVYLDDETENGSTVTLALDDATNITSLDIITNHISLEHRATGPITNTDLDDIDAVDAENEDGVTIATSNATFADGFETYLLTGMTYTPGGTVTADDFEAVGTAVFSPGANNVTVSGNWTFSSSGTLTTSGTITFDATDTGNTLSGGMTGTRAFYQIAFSGIGGAWTIEDSMTTTATTTSSFVIGNGTVEFGNGNGDNLEVDGTLKIANTSGQTGTLQTPAITQGSVITIDINQNNAGSPPACANCKIIVGASSGAGQGNLKIRKNTVLRLNPNAVSSNTYLELSPTGYLEIQGTQDDTGTTNSTVNETILTDTTKAWTADEHIGKHVRMTSGNEIGKTYEITDNDGTTLTRASTASSDATISSIVGTSGPTRKVCSNSTTLITANRQEVGRYLNDKTGTTGYLRIAYSNNDDSACSSKDSFTVVEDPGAFTMLATSDTFAISDAILQGDAYEIIDYANVTAESGTACSSTVNQSYEAYIYGNQDSETLVQYADICNFGNSSNPGFQFANVNDTDSNEGVTVRYSRFHGNYRGIALNVSHNNTIEFNESYGNATYGIYLVNSTYNTINSNRSYGHSNYSIVVMVSSNYNNFTSNKSYNNTSSYGFYVSGSHNNNFTSNQMYNNSTHGVYSRDGASNNRYISNTVYGNGTDGFNINDSSKNNFITSNLIYTNASAGITLISAGVTNNTISSNQVYSNIDRGVYISGAANNTLISNNIYSNQSGVHSVGSTGTIIINDNYGVSGGNARDIRIQDGATASTLRCYNCTLNSTTEFSNENNVAGSYFASFKHDGVAGATKIFHEYSVPDAVTETPQSDEVNKFNYASNLWEKSATAHGYYGTGTEDTNLSYDLSTATLSSGPYSYRATTKTAGVGASCVTSQAVFDVYRNGTDTGLDATSGTQFTDTTDGVNVKFTIDCGTTPYALGATYTFTTWDADNSASVNAKTLTMAADGDKFTVGSGKTLEMKGQSTGTNETTVTRGSTGGYNFAVAGTIDAQYYKFSYLGGTGGGLGLDLQSGATVTNLANGTYDNYQNVGATDTYLRVHSDIIGTGSPTKTFANITFTEASDNVPEYTITESGGTAPANGYYWLFYPTTCTGWADCESSDSEQNTVNGGSIRWDTGMTISGTVWTNEGKSTNIGSNKTVHLFVNSTDKSTTETDANGAFSFPGLTGINAADSVIVYLDDETENGSTVTLAIDGATNITSLDIITSHISLEHRTAGPITNTDLDDIDGVDATDEDGITIATSNATFADGFETYLLTGMTYTPGGTVTCDDFEAVGTAVFSPGANNVTVSGNWTFSGTGTLTTSGTVTFDATDTGNTLSGGMTGTRAFYQIAFAGTGGAWTIEDSMTTTATTTSSFVIGNGTVEFGNGNGDNLEVDGTMKIANTANQTGTFQTPAISQGSVITIDINQNNAGSPPACANCKITVGAASGTGQGNLKVRKNTVLRLNPNSASSDTGLEVEATGYLEIAGTQDDTGTSDGTTNETILTDTTKAWTTDAHIGKHIRMTSGNAIGKTYEITDNDATTLTRASTASADATISSIIGSSGPTRKVCSNATTLITADRQEVGRYLNDKTGTTGYLRIAYSNNNDSACSSKDSFTVVEDPGSFTMLATSDTFAISDAILQSDAYEIIDYANVTAESGTACSSTINQSYEAYIYGKQDSETSIQYADICNLGRAIDAKQGIQFATMNHNDANEGVTFQHSRIHANYRGVILTYSSYNTLSSNQSYGNSVDGFNLYQSTNNTLTSNLVYGNGADGILLNSSSNYNILTSNRAYNNKTGIYFTTSDNNTVTLNQAYANYSYYGFRVNATNNTFTSNQAYGNNQYGIYMAGASNNTFISNQIYVNSSYGVAASGSSNNTFISNQFYKTGPGIHFYSSSNNNILITNQSYENSRGLSVENSMGTSVFGDNYGGSGVNTYDVYFGDTTSPSTVRCYNCTMASTTEASGVTYAGAYLASFKHDGTAGTTKIWGEYSIPDAVTETPQSDEVNKFNYASNLWEKSATAHGYYGTGTEDTNLSYDLSTADLSSGPYSYRATANTAGVGASCATSQAVFDVYRNGTDTGLDATSGIQFTDTSGGVNVKFTIDCGTTPYAVGATYTFTTWDADNSASVNAKTLTMANDGDKFTVGSGKTLEMKGQSAGTNETTVTRGSTGGYNFAVAGTIDAEYYKFSYLGGTGGGLGLDLQSTATVTNLANGTYDNYQNAGATDTYLRVHSDIIGTGSPTKTFANLTFLEAPDNVPEYTITESGGTAPANGYYWLFYPATCTGWADCETSDSEQNTTGGGSIRWSINTAPNNPSSLVQKKTDDTVISEGGWTNETSVKYTATADDTDNPDTLYLCIETDPIGTAFSGTEDSCGSEVSYSGTPVTVAHTIASQTDATQYHWQARVKDSYGDYSSWVSYGTNTDPNDRDYGIDTTAPSGGTAKDGQLIGADLDWNTDGSLTELLGNWDGTEPDSSISGLNKYEYAIRRKPDDYYWTPGTPGSWSAGAYWYDNSTTKSFTVSNLNLATGVTYYYSLRTTDNAANSAVIDSNGIQVTPTLSFSIDSNEITFNDLNNGNNWTNTKTTTFTTSTNAAGGYTINGYTSDYLRSLAYVTEYIADFVGDWTTPQDWANFCKDDANDCGFGYTSNDTSVGGSNRFQGGTYYAKYSQIAPGDALADHTDAVNGFTGAVTNEQFIITHKVSVDQSQTATQYQAILTVICTANY